MGDGDDTRPYGQQVAEAWERYLSEAKRLEEGALPSRSWELVRDARVLLRGLGDLDDEEVTAEVLARRMPMLSLGAVMDLLEWMETVGLAQSSGGSGEDEWRNRVFRPVRSEGDDR